MYSGTKIPFEVKSKIQTNKKVFQKNPNLHEILRRIKSIPFTKSLTFSNIIINLKTVKKIREKKT